MNSPYYNHRSVLDTPDRELGREIGFLLLTMSEWVHRRVDSRHFVGDSRARRHVSMDLQTHLRPAFGYPVVEDVWPDALVLPLTLLKKEPLTEFDLRDEKGESVPVLTADENVWVAWSILVAAAEAVIEDDLSDEEINALRAVASASANTAPVELERLSTHERLKSAIDESPVFRRFAADLADKFLLLAVVPEDGRSRRILKYSHGVDFSSRSLRSAGRISSLWRLGISQVRIGAQIPRLDTRSYHLEFEAPPGLQLTGSPEFKEMGPTDSAVTWTVESRQTSALAHVHISAGESVSSPIGAPKSVFVPSGQVRLFFFPVARGLVRAAAGLSWLVILLMGLGWQYPTELVAAKAEADASGPAALLLAIVGVIALFIAKPGEHVFVTRLLYPLRLLLVIAGGLVPFLAALSLTVDSFGSEELKLIWGSLLAVSVACSLILTLSLTLALKHERTSK